MKTPDQELIDLKKDIHYLIVELFYRLEGKVDFDNMPTVIQTKEAILKRLEKK